MLEIIYSTICNRWKREKRKINKALETVEAVYTHNTVLNKRKNIALGSANFEVGICNVMVASVYFVTLIDDS